MDGASGGSTRREVVVDREWPVLKDHEIAEVFPLLSRERLESLGRSIVESGLRHPIVLFEEKILDGRNRYRAMLKAGYEPRPQDFVDFEGDWDAAVRFVVDENLERRDLTVAERAFAADALAGLGKGRPVNSSGELISQSVAAQRLGTSPASVKRARVVRSKGSPELVEAARSGEIALEPAAELTKLPAERQREAVAGGPAEVRKAVAEAKTVRPAVRVEASESERRMRQLRNGRQIAADLIRVMTVVEQAVAALTAGAAVFGPAEVQSSAMVLRRIRVGAEWLAAVGPGKDVGDEMQEWLRGEQQ